MPFGRRYLGSRRRPHNARRADIVAPSADAAASKKPVITSLSEHTGPTRGSTKFNINGKNFTKKSKVKFGREERKVRQVRLIEDARHGHASRKGGCSRGHRHTGCGQVEGRTTSVTFGSVLGTDVAVLSPYASDGHGTPVHQRRHNPIHVTTSYGTSMETSLSSATVVDTPGTITGVVTDSYLLSPLADVDIRQYSAPGALLKSVTTSSDGSYAFPSTPSGSYLVCFFADTVGISGHLSECERHSVGRRRCRRAAQLARTSR